MRARVSRLLAPRSLLGRLFLLEYFVRLLLFLLGRAACTRAHQEEEEEDDDDDDDDDDKQKEEEAVSAGEKKEISFSSSPRVEHARKTRLGLGVHSAQLLPTSLC